MPSNSTNSVAAWPSASRWNGRRSPLAPREDSGSIPRGGSAHLPSLLGPRFPLAEREGYSILRDNPLPCDYTEIVADAACVGLRTPPASATARATTWGGKGCEYRSYWPG